MGYLVVTHQDGTLAHHLEAGSLPYDFVFYSVMVPFLVSDEELG